MNTGLRIFAIIHTAMVFLVCLNGVSMLRSEEDTALNKYGAAILERVDVDLRATTFSKVMKVYGECTGTARGYSFFSPNVAPLEKTP